MLSREDDIQILIRGCLRNDRKAQEQLYRKFYPAMMSLCVRYTKNKEDAVEVINDGFLKVFKNMELYDAAKASLYTWMRKVMINTAIDFIRRQHIHADMDMLPDFEEGPAIENEALLKFSGEELMKMIRQLPDTTGLVFNLYAIDGFNHREIGALLQMSEGTSRWHLSEARKQLKKLIRLMESKR